MNITAARVLGPQEEHIRSYFYEWVRTDAVRIYLLFTLREKNTQFANELYQYLRERLENGHFESVTSLRSELRSHHVYKDVELFVCLFDEGKIYALLGNGTSLYLKRDNRIIPLLETLGSTSSVISGHTKKADQYILETVEAHRLFNKEMLSLGALHVSEKLNSTDASGGVGVVFLEVHEEPPFQGKSFLKSKTANLIDKLLALLPERHIVIHDPEGGPKKSKKAALIGIIVLIILGVSIYFGVNKRKESLIREEYEPKLTEAIHDFNESLELSSLSLSRSKELILSSRRKAKELKNDGVKDERLDELLANITNHLGEIAGIYDISPSLFLDLSIVSSGFKGSSLSLADKNLRVLDAESKKLVGIDLDNKRTEIISGPDYLPDAISTAAYADRSFVLSSDGIREVTEEVNLTIKSEWNSKNVLFAAFAGNIYVLDKDNNKIWRYQGITGGFLEKEEWLGEGINVNLSDVVDWAIDGSIWTVNKSGEINIYSQGIPAQFSLTGMEGSFSDVAALYTDDTSKFVYVLDKGEGKVSVIAKNGQYIGEYIASEITASSDFVVSEDISSIIFLADGKLFVVQAKHLESQNENDK